MVSYCRPTNFFSFFTSILYILLVRSCTMFRRDGVRRFKTLTSEKNYYWLVIPDTIWPWKSVVCRIFVQWGPRRACYRQFRKLKVLLAHVGIFQGRLYISTFVFLYWFHRHILPFCPHYWALRIRITLRSTKYAVYTKNYISGL